MIKGVIRTRVGYAGGKKPDPDYGNLRDHTETVQIDYDPRQITYAQLLDIFWRSHSPTDRSWSRQYMNAVFYHDETQEQLALASKLALEKKLGRKVRTSVLPVRSFYRAEDYHQKHFLKRRHGLFNELTRIYENHHDLVDSTAAARMNGYAGGYGSSDQLSHEIGRLGLTEKGKRLLLELVR